MSSLVAERRGAAYVEFLIAIVPFFLFVLCVLQSAMLQFADIAVERAASAAARSAVVVLDDDPRFYGGEARNSAAPGGPRAEAIKRGAANVLGALPAAAIAEMQSRLSVEFMAQPGSSSVRSSFAPEQAVTVRVTYQYPCGVPLARQIMCRDEGLSARLGAEATLPNQGARYSYGGGQ